MSQRNIFSVVFFLLKAAGATFLGALILVAFAAFIPKNFPERTILHIPPATYLTRVSTLLAEKHYITSPFLFKVIVTAFYGHRSIVAGDYSFTQKENIWKIASRLVQGDENLTPVKVTIPEGSTVADIAWILLKKMPNFNAPKFMEIAHDHEGYLFPDTYIFNPNKTSLEIFTAFRHIFDEKFATLADDIRLSGRSPRDVVIMASILEKEASRREEREMISGILWKRLDEGIPLQVDVPLVYITGNAYVSLDDTKIDSRYNTYKYKGLPIAPIANPGLDALSATVHPRKSPYYFYLSDSKGNIHYATTYAAHLVNKAKYMR